MTSLVDLRIYTDSDLELKEMITDSLEFELHAGLDRMQRQIYRRAETDRQISECRYTFIQSFRLFL